MKETQLPSRKHVVVNIIVSNYVIKLLSKLAFKPILIILIYYCSYCYKQKILLSMTYVCASVYAYSFYHHVFLCIFEFYFMFRFKVLMLIP